MTPHRLWRFLTTAMLEIVLVILFVTLCFANENFLTRDNLLNILQNISIQGVIALGMTIVIIAGEIDLSVGSMVAFSACLMAWVVQKLAAAEHPISPAAQVVGGGLVALFSGALVGAISGAMRTRFAVPTFITTLAWFRILRGGALQITGGFSIQSFPDWFGFLGSGYLFHIPFVAVVFVIIFVLTHFLMKHTPFGRAVYAIGGNAEAARLSGIRVTRIKIAVMIIVAVLAAFAGILQAAQIMTGSPSTATGWELDVISAVIIGGTSLAGGSGSVWGTLVGLLFVGVLANGMTLLNIDESWQMIVSGGLILIAVMINMAPASRRST